MVNYNLWYKNIMQKEYFMKKTIVCVLLAVVLVLAFTACSGSGGGGGQRLTGTDSFKFTVINNGTAYRVSAGTATEGTVNIPAYYRPNADSDYLPVTVIMGIEHGAFNRRGAFAGCKNITKITIPSTVTTIGYDAFSDCTNLTSIKLPESITSIDYSAFANCTSLASITIPKSVIYMNDNEGAQFYGWTSSQTINVPFANQAAADTAWGTGWRFRCEAQINYLGK